MQPQPCHPTVWPDVCSELLEPPPAKESVDRLSKERRLNPTVKITDDLLLVCPLAWLLAWTSYRSFGGSVFGQYVATG